MSDLSRMKLDASVGAYVNSMASILIFRSFPASAVVAVVKDTITDILVAILAANRSGGVNVKIKSYTPIFDADGELIQTGQIELENPNSDQTITDLQVELTLMRTKMYDTLVAYKNSFPIPPV